MTFQELSSCLDSRSLALEQLTILRLNLAECSGTLRITKRDHYGAFEQF